MSIRLSVSWFFSALSEGGYSSSRSHEYAGQRNAADGCDSSSSSGSPASDSDDDHLIRCRDAAAIDRKRSGCGRTPFHCGPGRGRQTLSLLLTLLAVPGDLFLSRRLWTVVCQEEDRFDLGSFPEPRCFPNPWLARELPSNVPSVDGPRTSKGRLKKLVGLQIDSMSLKSRQYPIANPARKAGGRGRRFDNLRPHDGSLKNIHLKLHQKIVGSRATVDAKLIDAHPRIMLHRIETSAT